MAPLELGRRAAPSSAGGHRGELAERAPLDLPGLTSDDLDIQLVDDYLYLFGERKRPELSEGTFWAHTERAFGRFERRIQLPKGVDADNITASMDNGVLSLIVPKPERLKPHALAIGSGAHTEQRELEPANA